VAYKSPHPDEQTREEVMNKLKKNNIHASQLVEYRTDYCLQAESSTLDGLHRP
jgi:hypothetical protein